MTTLTEADVESAALDWLATIGWQTAHGPDIAPDTPGTERADYAQAVLETRLQDALARLNPFLPATALGAALSSGPHHQDSGEAKIGESTAGVSRKPSSDGKARGSSSKHLCGLTAWNT